MKFITELSHLFGVKNDTEKNNDCTDFPTKPCKLCGSTSNPQWKGVCNRDCDPLGILSKEKECSNT